MGKEYDLKRSVSMLLDATASISLGLAKEAIDKKTARAEQKKIAKKVVARYGVCTAFKSVAIYKRAIFDASKNGKLEVVAEQDGKKSVRTIALYTYGIDEYFRSMWPDLWKETIEKERKTRPKLTKKGAKK